MHTSTHNLCIVERQNKQRDNNYMNEIILLGQSNR